MSTASAAVPERRTRAPLPVALGLVGASLVAAVAMALAGVPIVSASELGWVSALTAAMAGVRVAAERLDVKGGQALAAYWANLALAAGAIWLSPAFGLYLFLGYYESTLFGQRAQRLAGMVATAFVVSLAQVGGPRSVLFTPAVYLAFVAVNLGATALMGHLDRQRERLLTELARANAELRTEQERSSLLRDQLIEGAREAGIAEERARLSREIHDTVAQDLVAIIAQLDAAASTPGAAERNRRLAAVDAAARGALGEARRAVRALASPRLDDTDLPLALDDLLGPWRAATGLAGEVIVTGRAAASGHDDALMRVAQEALANVARHACARRADVALAYGDGVSLTVRDDGVGFAPDAPHTGFGLAGMAARMQAIGGTLEVVSSGAGTTVTARLPGREEGA